FLKKYTEQAPKAGGTEPNQQLDNPVWHIHAGDPPPTEPDGLPFNILLNLVGVANTEDKAVLWGFISRYAPKASPATHPCPARLAAYATAYSRDSVKRTCDSRPPAEQERGAVVDLRGVLAKMAPGADSEAIQFEVYEVGKRHSYAVALRALFKVLYEVLFG